MKIDKLIEIVSKGGSVKTGVNIFNKRGILLLEKDVLVNKVNTLLRIKKYGVVELDINPEADGGVWDKTGALVPHTRDALSRPRQKDSSRVSEIERKIKEISQHKKEAAAKYKKAKQNIKQVILDIRETGGEFDMNLVEETVSDIFNFLVRNDTAFSYLTKEIFSYDDYLYNHSINVCTIGTAVLNRFNDHFCDFVNNYLKSFSQNDGVLMGNMSESFVNYQPGDLQSMSIGYFLHDVGKVLIPDEILNKEGRLTPEEFEVVKTHSFGKGPEILRKNNMSNPIIHDIIRFHHCPLFKDEYNCYPGNKLPIEIPPYVKIAKLADIYDAMTSKRCYKEAFNPINVVTEIFRKYANKDHILQFILHSFVKIVGIHPPGSIITLNNGQLAFVLDSQGPLVLPFTDTHGRTLSLKPDPVDLAHLDESSTGLNIDKQKPLQTPIEVIQTLPPYIRDSLGPEVD